MKKRIIIGVIITLLLSVLTIINMMGGNKNEYTSNGGDTSSNEYSNTIVKTTTTNETTTSTSVTTITTKKKTTRQTTKETQKVGTYTLTHYGPDCKGCGGTTASGYNVRNTIYYNDATYGKLRIVAMKYMPLYSVIKIKNYKSGGDIYAIVLDRPRYNIIDLLVESESKARDLGTQKNIEIEVLRNGK